MRALDTAGRRMAFWGAVLLILWAGYELSIRWDTIQKSGYTVMLMARDMGAGLWDVLFKYRFIDVLHVPLVLLGCVLLGALALVLRNRRRAAYLLIPLCALFACLNVGARVFFSGSLWQLLKAVPLALIGLGQAVNAGVDVYIRQHKRAALAPARRRLPRGPS